MILLFFGSFNPVHAGHIFVARAALKKYTLAELWFILSAQNPFKIESDLWDYDRRLNLLEKAIADEEKLTDEKGAKVKDNSRMKICTIERDLPQPSYTIDTLNILTEKYPQEKFLLLMGQDNLQEITMWKDYKKILKRFPIVVYPREGGRTRPAAKVPVLPKYAKITFLDEVLLDYSSTKIRNFTM